MEKNQEKNERELKLAKINYWLTWASASLSGLATTTSAGSTIYWLAEGKYANTLLSAGAALLFGYSTYMNGKRISIDKREISSLEKIVAIENKPIE